MLEQAKWIASAFDAGSTCPVFRRAFTSEKAILRAALTITAVGCYNAYINGKRAGNFILAPGWTAYDKRVQVQRYDVSDMLARSNILDIEVGEGWRLGRMTCYSKRVYSPKQPAVIAELEIEYQDHTRETIVSDENFTAAKSQIIFSGIYDGELYDARQREYEWTPAKVIDLSKASLIWQEGEIIAEVQRLKPAAVTFTQAGDAIIDFGQNLTGYVEFTTRAPSGTLIELYHAELLGKDGDLYTENLRTAKQRIQYIAGGGTAVYKPRFTFQGFRYVRVENWYGELNPEDFTAIVVHSDLKRVGDFSCSNAKVNKLYQNIVWGQRGNYLDVPTDCPQRDERLGWTGDAQMFIKTAAYNYDVEKFFGKWLNDLRLEQFADGGIPAVIPNVLGKEGASSAAWGDAAVICPWQIYLSYGNKEILARQYDSMRKWVQYIQNQGKQPYLWDTGHQFGDWLALDAPYGTYTGATEPALIGTAYFAYSAHLTAKASKVLGYDASRYETLYEKIRAAYNTAFLKDGKLTSDTQTAHALTIYFDLAEDTRALGERLNTLVKENGNRLQTGFVGTPYLLHALSKTGHHETAYSLLLQEEFPSWLYSVNQGATTVWEHWDGVDDKGKLWSADMNSFNHYAYGAVGDWMYEVMAGIKIDEAHPAFERIIFQPVTDERLEYAEASVETRRGIVSSRWERGGGKVTYTFKVPQGCTADI
ncbi:MAG: glycoside hydrolase family 78 protein, partial [Clostridiales bacterium]|nr:glycoside hydrolase family 78 protein [Clostridiales bacterium]